MWATTKKMKVADNIGKYLFSVVPPPPATQLNFKQILFCFTQDYRQSKDDNNHKTVCNIYLFIIIRMLSKKAKIQYVWNGHTDSMVMIIELLHLT